MENIQIKNYLFKIISDKYFVIDEKPNLLDNFKHLNKFRYYEAKLSSFPKYSKKESTHGLKFGANRTYWIIILFCLLISAKLFYDFQNGSIWRLSGMIMILGFFLFVIMFFGYKLLVEYPIFEIKKDKLVYRKKEEILWDNIVVVGIIINRSGKPPSEKRIVIGTKQRQIKELKVSMLDSNIQNIVDIILKNVA
ncbi:hypothetical protein H7F37_01360 [Winogradskyella sp. PAMC22761]|nr:hypothetical protein H7F37_01360 [Winogradskyella sp. PAMC22761]